MPQGRIEADAELVLDALRVEPVGWAWIAVPADAVPSAVDRVRAFAEARNDAPWIALGNPLSGVEGFRRSHQQAQEAHAVAVASGSNALRVTAASDSGLSTAALLGGNVGTARVWVAEVLGPLASHTDNDERLRETLRVFLARRLELQSRRRGTPPTLQLRQISRATRDRTSGTTDQ